MKLYTGGGDEGQTSLFGGTRVSKGCDRVEAYGELDELNSALGVARAKDEMWPELDSFFARVQSELFDIGANLSTPLDSPYYDKIPKLNDAHIRHLEDAIDRASEAVKPLTQFILPGGSDLAAWLLFVRCIARRAERAIVRLAEHESIPLSIVVYLNRLSDLLFALGREANARAGVEEPTWTAQS